MSIWDVAGWLVALSLAVWLLKLAEGWYRWSEGFRVCSRPESHRREMAEIQQQVDELEKRLAWYQTTPNWFDVAYPVCGSPTPSGDGYCHNCYRALEDHALVGVS